MVRTRLAIALGPLLVGLLGCEAAEDPPRVSVPADAPLGTDPPRAAADGGHLGEALEGAEGPVRLELEPGIHYLGAEEYVDPSCGNCEDPDEDVPATLGARISGAGIEVAGPDPDSVVIHTDAGYGVLFEDCRNCGLQGVTVTGGDRDPDPRATSGAVLARRSDVRLEDCAIRDNVGDSDVVEETVAGVAGLVGREGADLQVEGCRVEGNSWDGIVLYRDARGVFRHNVVDGVAGARLASRGGAVEGGRGVGIGLTWNAEALVEGNLVRSYWKGIGVFSDASAEVRHNVVEDIRTWGISYWAAGDGQPSAAIHGNAIYDTGACGAMVAGPEEPRDEGMGELTSNAFVRTAGDPVYDDGAPYCTQRAVAREQVPEGFSIADNLFHDNRQPGEAPTDLQLSHEEFSSAVSDLARVLGTYPALRESAFLEDFGG